MRRIGFTLLLLVFGLFPATRLLSQQDFDNAISRDGDTTEHVDGLFIPAIPGAPFSARVDVQISTLLPDGTTVKRKFFNLITRDSQGRIYRERRRIVAENSPKDAELMESFVTDPMTRTRVACLPAKHTCLLTSYFPQRGLVEESVGQSRDGKSYLTREDLGTTTLDNLDVQHTRETRTYNPGAFGNDRPMAVTKEFWYSPQLQIILAVARNDPRSSVQLLQVNDLILAEPDPARFAAPEGYKITDERRAVIRLAAPVR